MPYRINFTFATEEEEKKADGLWVQDMLEIAPSLTESLMATIRPMEGKGGSYCQEPGARVEDVTPDRITIKRCCQTCRDSLIKNILESLGTKIVILVE
jgi:hypothetical protein